MPSKLVNRPAPEAGTGSDTPDFESIYDALPIPVVLLDGRRRILRVNQAFEQCFELTQQEVAGREEPQFSAIAAALEEPGPAPDRHDKPAGQAGGVHRFVTASGRHLEVNIKASTLIRGRQRFSVLLCQEPREYSQNATLQLSQADVFRLTIEQSPVPTTIQDAQFRILLANRATCELFGMTQEELLGTDPTYLYSEDSLRAGLLDRQRVRESTSDPTAVKIVGVRELVNPRTGEAISFRAEATRVIGLNGETMWCAMLFDLRKTLALETRLRAQIEWMERAFDNAPVGMLVTRAGNGSLVRVNKTLSQITGLTDEAKLSALAGKVIAQERHVLADGRGERRRHVQSRRFPLTNGNGEQQWLDGFATELTSAEGESVIITVINDATREQLLKNELSTSLMQQSALLRCMDAGMAHVVGEIVVQVNPALLEMIGKPEAQVLGQPLEALFGEPNNWRRLESAALAALDQTGLYRTTERILRADGSVRRCEVTLRRINENRADLGVLVTLTDVSDLLEQADLLRQSIDDMQVFSNVGTVGVATLDTGRLVHANDVMATLLARPPEQLVGARFADYCEADPALQLETLLDASGGLVRETVLRASLLRTEQSAIDCLLHVTPVTNGDRALVTVVAVDLNQRNAALALAVRMHLRFDAFAASLNEAVVVLAPGCGEIIHANPAAGEVFGIEPAILLRLSSSRLWTGVASESRPQLEQALSDLSIGKPSVTVVSMEHPDGRQMTVRLRMFGGDPGHPEHYLLAEDISEERQQERRRLEEAVAQRETLVREVHHRIKNNLQGVAGLLQQTAIRHPELEPILADVIGQIHAIAQVHGLQFRRQETLCPSEIVAAIADNLRANFGQRLEFIDELGAQKTWGLPEGEAVPLALVINELMTNAFKHSGPEAMVRVTVLPRREGVTIKVANMGRLPAGFSFDNQPLSASGLGLVKALIPRRGTAMRFEQQDLWVIVTLSLSEPALRMVCASANLAQSTELKSGFHRHGEGKHDDAAQTMSNEGAN